jgi:hypothetical protein
MQHSCSRLLILFVCLIIVIDDIHGIKLRMPSIRVSATFSKTVDKKKNHHHHRVRDLRDDTIRSHIHPTGGKNEL